MRASIFEISWKLRKFQHLILRVRLFTCPPLLLNYLKLAAYVGDCDEIATNRQANG